MNRPTNDQVAERARRLAERLQRREAYQQTTKEIRHDQPFPKEIRWVAEETDRLQNQRHLGEGAA